MLTRSNRKYDRFLNSEQLSGECQCLTCRDIFGLICGGYGAWLILYICCVNVEDIFVTLE